MDNYVKSGLWRRHHGLKIITAVSIWAAFIVLLYAGTRPRNKDGTAAHVLKVGALPVTCNLTGPIACMNMTDMHMSGMDMSTTANGEPTKVAARDGDGGYVARFERYSGWPEVKEALMAGKIGAAYLLAPLAMDLADRGIPVRIVALGHRSGAVIMVKKGDPARNLGDLRGKRVAIPSRFAVDHLFVRLLMKKYGLHDGDLKLVEIAPPDMPAALYAGAVDAFATGEPFGAQAEKNGQARILHWTRQDWPTYVCCVLAVRTDMIQKVRPLVQQLVDNVLSAGIWLENSDANRQRAADLAARPEFFNQDPELLRYVLSSPRDRVTYGNLGLVREELENLMRLGLDAKIIDHPIPYETYADETFIRRYRPREIRIGS